MPDRVILDSNEHRQLRVITSRGAEFGENVHFVPVVADELASLVVDYAVCLMKDNDTGQFGLYALLGFGQGENLYLDGDRWRANYIPMHVRRQPFLIGRPSSEKGRRETAGEPMIGIDLNSKRVQEQEGEALFNADGSRTAFLEEIDALLSRLIGGMETTRGFIDALSELDLIEAAQLDVTFADNTKQTYSGIYTVHDGKLTDLRGDALQRLHERGYLRACHLILASIGHVRKLIDLKNAQAATSNP